MNIKRILATLLAVTVVGASMPAVSVNFPKISLTANAADTESHFEYQTLEDGTIEITFCDKSVTTVEIPAEMDGKKVTTIGKKAFYGCKNLTSVTISNGVTSIGESAFEECMSLTEITIPNSVTSIGEEAFCECFGLTSVTISNGITSISYETFRQCSNLTSITIPNSVTSIEGYAFGSCSSLTEVTIPDSVTSIEGYAFGSCSGLTSINVSENNKNYADIDGVLFNKDKTELVTYPIGKNETKYTIPNSVLSIGERAFYKCLGLTDITIPESVTSIGEYAFYSSGLTLVTIPDSVTSIGGDAFSGTPWLENKQKENPLVIENKILIDVPTDSDEVTIPDSVTIIGGGAFAECTKLTSVTIPDSVTSIGEGAFYACSSLTSITIPDSVTSIGGATFAGCTKLTSVTISNSVTNIGDWMFNKCWSLTSITIPNSVTSIGEKAFYNSRLTLVTIPNKVTSIGAGAFEESNLTSITIPDSVTSIGEDAFCCCSDLTSITILNPNCEIYDSRLTISNDANRAAPFNGTIYGYENSTAQAYAEKYKRNFELIGDAPATKVIAGDANCDGKVSIADATAILQHLGNQDKYGLSAEGLKNADVDENDGVSTNDALVIQMVDAKLLTVEQLPLKK